MDKVSYRQLHNCSHDLWIERAGDLFWWNGEQFPFRETVLVMANNDDPHYTQGFRSWAEIDAFIKKMHDEAEKAFGPRPVS